MAILAVLNIAPADAWVEIQPCSSDIDKKSVATSLRSADNDGLLVRHVAALAVDETVAEGVARVAAMFQDAGLKEVRVVKDRLANLFETFQSEEALAELAKLSTGSVVLH